MPRPAPSIWFSLAELAAERLPGMPCSKNKIALRADTERWACKTDENGQPLARRRKGKGGGYEYNIQVLPIEARQALAKRAPAPNFAHVANDQPIDPASPWVDYDRLSDKTKAEAERRLLILQHAEQLVGHGMSRTLAVADAAHHWSVSAASIWNWMACVKGVAKSDWLPRLAPRYSGGGKEADVDAEIWRRLLSDYLRLSKPSWASCYRRAEQDAESLGLHIPDARTLWRKLEREVPPQVIALKREGPDAVRKLLPPQQRTVENLHAMELVNIDGHTCDVRVEFPDGTIQRPTMVAIQDVYSRKFLAWRIAKTEDSLTARLCFADLFRKYGLPNGVLADNGRAWASKWLSGGTKTRFRFKVRDEDPLGLFAQLGIEVHWAKPFRGQSKPIERGFRDFCDDIARHAAFDGAYTGNNALNKPDNYGQRAIPLAEFLRVWSDGVARHNARPKRRTEIARGRDSFDAVFERSYAAAPIRKATAEQLRLALLAADQLRAKRPTGELKIFDNRYWTPELTPLAGQLVTVRFDPEDLTQPIHIYARDGKFVASAPLLEKAAFLSAADAKERGKLESEYRKATREQEKKLDLLKAAQLADVQASLFSGEPDVPSPSIIRPYRPRGNTAAALKQDRHSIPDRQAAQDTGAEQFFAALRLVHKD